MLSSKAASEAAAKEAEFHETAQRNALGGYIGCDGPICWKLIQDLSIANAGHKIQSAR